MTNRVAKTDEEIELFYTNAVLPLDKRSINEILEEENSTHIPDDAPIYDFTGIMEELGLFN